MAFPVNGILDNFNRANSASTVGSNWTAFIATGGSSGNEGILSNQLYNPHGGFSNYTAMYWNPSTFGPDCEVYITIPTIYTYNGQDNFNLYLRLQNIISLGNYNGYSLKVLDSNGGFSVNRVDGGISTQLGSVITQNIASGDKIGMSMIGNTLTVYHDSGSGWTVIATRTDTTYPNAGYIGWYIPGNMQDGRFDDFGGGSMSAPTVTDSAATNVADITAIGNGNVTNDGGAPITERGFVISTIANPTTVDDKFTVSGTTGAYTGALTGLNPNTTYYIRAYAINDVGTSYGSDQTFSTSGYIIRDDRDDDAKYDEKLAIRQKLNLTNANFSRYDLRKLFYAADNKMVSQNDAIRAFLQSQLGNTTTQSLNDLWRLYFIFKGVTNQSSLGDMAKDFFTNVGF